MCIVGGIACARKVLRSSDRTRIGLQLQGRKSLGVVASDELPCGVSAAYGKILRYVIVRALKNKSILRFERVSCVCALTMHNVQYPMMIYLDSHKKHVL